VKPPIRNILYVPSDVVSSIETVSRNSRESAAYGEVEGLDLQMLVKTWIFNYIESLSLNLSQLLRLRQCTSVASL